MQLDVLETNMLFSLLKSCACTQKFYWSCFFFNHSHFTKHWHSLSPIQCQIVFNQIQSSVAKHAITIIACFSAYNSFFHALILPMRWCAPRLYQIQSVYPYKWTHCMEARHAKITSPPPLWLRCICILDHRFEYHYVLSTSFKGICLLLCIVAVEGLGLMPGITHSGLLSA